MRTRLCFAVPMLLAVAFALQEPQPIPPFEGDGNSQHDGQPQWCQNTDAGGHAKNCDCQPKMEDEECRTGKPGGGDTAKCSVFCRKDACKCKRLCGDTR